jgi:hypothetical protein
MLGTWLAVTGVPEFALGTLCIGVVATGAAAPPSAELGVGGRTLGSAGGGAVRRGSIWKLLFRGSEADSAAAGCGGGAVEYELCE